MMTLTTLSRLHRSLATEHVLSVYVDFATPNPADRDTWRTALDHALEKARDRLAGTNRGERAAFDQSVAHLERAVELAARDSAVGWCAFITASGVREAHALSTHVPTLAMWNIGACIAPYVRVLRNAEAVWFAIADSRKVALYQYHAGTLTPFDKFRAFHPVDEPAHMGNQVSPHFHSGTHGASGHDAAQRSLIAGRDRMLDEASDRLDALASETAWIVVGGIPVVAAQLADRLPARPRRVVTRVSLDVHASAAQITAAARSAACALHGARDTSELTELLELENDGLATTGAAVTNRALDEARVKTLYITPHYLDTCAEASESAVRSALDQHAELALINGDAAAHLDGIGGIAARLRYRTARDAARAN